MPSIKKINELAHKQHMSYGKWVSLNEASAPHSKDNSKIANELSFDEKDLPVRYCIICGKEFKAKGKQIMCGNPECKRKRNRYLESQRKI